MRSRMAVITGFFLCMTMLCAGCQQTPQEVRERMDDYGENAQMESGDIRYCTVDQLRKFDTKDMDVALDNMELPEKVDFSQVESVSVLEMSFEKSFTDNKEQVAGVFGIDADGLEEGPADYQGRNFELSTDENYFTICDSGFFSYFTGLNMNMLEDDGVSQTGFLGQYDLDVEDVSEKTVDFGSGEEAGISVMCGKAEKWLNDNIPLNGCRCHAVDAYVREMKTQRGSRRRLSLGMDISYNGIRFNSYALGGDFDPEEYSIWVDYDSADLLSGFSNGTGLLKVDTDKPVETIVDFESAVKIVNAEVSGFHEKKITKILPLYVLHPEYEGGKHVYPVAGQKVTARPAYAFLIKTGEDDSEFGINKSNVYNVALVDMVTGELSVYFGNGD